jgi:hypothetical protein
MKEDTVWEYSHIDERFEVSIRIMHDPRIDAQTLNEVSQSISDLVDEFATRVRTLVEYEDSDRRESSSLSHDRS